MNLRFQWDPRKAAANQRKHGVSFADAQSVFFDECALLMADPDHSEHEERFLLLGLGLRAKLIVVCHCYRDCDEVIRIISARPADRGERDQYLRRWKA